MSNKEIGPLPTSLTSSKLVFHGVRFDVRTLELRNNKGIKVQKDIVIHPGAVVILPLIDSKTFYMIRNERFAVGETLWELPAGTLEPEENLQETAYRELIEETGYKAQKMTHLLSFYTSPGICNEMIHAFVAEDLTEVGQHLDDSEKITVEKISWDQALEMIKEGIIRDAKTISTLLFYLRW